MTWRTERAVSWTTAGSILSIRLLLLLLLLYLLLLLLFSSFVHHSLVLSLTPSAVPHSLTPSLPLLSAHSLLCPPPLSPSQGRHTVSASIGGEALLGSPFTIEMMPGAPALEQTKIARFGLEGGKRARVGDPFRCLVTLRDAFGNSIGASPEQQQGMRCAGMRRGRSWPVWAGKAQLDIHSSSSSAAHGGQHTARRVQGAAGDFLVQPPSLLKAREAPAGCRCCCRCRCCCHDARSAVHRSLSPTSLTRAHPIPLPVFSTPHSHSHDPTPTPQIWDRTRAEGGEGEA